MVGIVKLLMLNPRILISLNLVVFVSILSFRPAVATGNETGTGDAKAAKAEFEKGVELYNAERYEDAASAFRSAFQLKPSWMLHYNIAQSEAAAKHYGRSFEEFEKYLAAGGDDVPEQRQTYVEKELERLEGLVGSLEIEGPEGATVFVDDLERGTLPIHGRLKLAVSTVHDVIVKLNGESIFETKVQVSRGEVIQLDANQEGPSSESAPDNSDATADDVSGGARVTTMPEGAGRTKLSPLFWTGLAGTVATGIASGIMWGLSMKKHQEELDAGDAYNDASKDWEEGNAADIAEEKFLRDKHETLGDEMISRRNAAIVLTATTGAFAVLTTVGLILSKKKKPHQSSRVSIVPGGMTVQF